MVCVGVEIRQGIGTQVHGRTPSPREIAGRRIGTIGSAEG
jgi:hypothetical protein